MTQREQLLQRQVVHTQSLGSIFTIQQRVDRLGDQLLPLGRHPTTGIVSSTVCWPASRGCLRLSRLRSNVAGLTKSMEFAKLYTAYSLHYNIRTCIAAFYHTHRP